MLTLVPLFIIFYSWAVLFVSIVPDEDFPQHIYSMVHKGKKSSDQPSGESVPMGQQVQSFYALTT